MEVIFLNNLSQDNQRVSRDHKDSFIYDINK